MLAFKTDRYKTTTLHEDGSHVVHQAYRDVLASILHTKLGKLDKKYHSDLPAIINEWTRHHELMNVEPVEKEEDNNEAGVDEASLAEQAEHARASMSIVELDYLKQAWSSWIRSAEESQTEHAPSAKDRSSRIKSMVRERLGALETAEYVSMLTACQPLC